MMNVKAMNNLDRFMDKNGVAPKENSKKNNGQAAHHAGPAVRAHKQSPPQLDT